MKGNTRRLVNVLVEALKRAPPKGYSGDFYSMGYPDDTNVRVSVNLRVGDLRQLDAETEDAVTTFTESEPMVIIDKRKTDRTIPLGQIASGSGFELSDGSVYIKGVGVIRGQTVMLTGGEISLFGLRLRDGAVESFPSNTKVKPVKIVAEISNPE